MAIEPVPPFNKALQTDSLKLNDKNVKPVPQSTSSSQNLGTDVKVAVDKATGILQTIVTDKISDKVLRKIPSDEYLQLLRLLDNIADGSISKRI